MYIFRKIASVSILLALLLAATPQYTAHAAVGIVVNNNVDDTLTNLDANNTCDLREAITNVNDNAQTYTDCTGGSGINMITFDNDYTITLTSALPDITASMTISGDGHSVTIDGNSSYAIFNVPSSGTLTIDSLTLTNGVNTISNEGTLSITNSTLRNGVGTFGGVFSSFGSVTVANSTFYNNNGSAVGAIANFIGLVDINNSTFYGNSGSWAGAIFTSSACFSEGTRVLMADGSTKNIEDIAIGDQVLSYDPDAGSQVSAQVTNVMSHPAKHLLLINSLEVTFEHPFAVGNGKWKLAGSLEVGDRVLSSDGWTTVNSIKPVEAETTVYNITVDRTHTYYVSDGTDTYLVHNKSLPSSAGEVELTNSIITNSTGGDCVISSAGSFTGGNNLIDDYASGACSGISSAAVTNLDTSLADNGGSTQTLALLSSSNAIDTGNGATCESDDQRGVDRSSFAPCDIGAYEYSAEILTVTNTTPSAGATLTSLSTIKVTFSEAALADGSTDAADNTVNYLLVEAGTNSKFDTVSCAGGPQTDDTQVTISGATYDNASLTATLTLGTSLKSPADDGSYRLFICGTTSIWSAAGLELNNGASDTTLDFTIQVEQVDTPTNTATSLPATGFAPGRVTKLPPQPASKAYTSTQLTLEIPKLGVTMNIVGVPQSETSWDVTWLGQNAGWLNGSAFPTWSGNTVLTGHVWDAYNRPGPFANLKTLKYGDQFYIHAWGQTYTYEVRESNVYWKNSAVSKVLQHEELDWVTLLTCETYNPFNGDYLFRRAVRAVLVSVK